MTHEKELALAKQLNEQRKELRQKAYDRIEELVKANGNRINIKVPVLAEDYGLGHSFDHYEIIAFEFACLKGWLTGTQKAEPTTNIIYNTHGAGGIVPLPTKCQVKDEARTPATAWRLVELVEDALGI